MEGLFPFLSTLLWVGVFAILIWRYHQSFDGILLAFKKRIESGSGIEAGPFKLTEVRPQSSEQQVERLNQEVAEIENESSNNQTTLGSAIRDTETIKTRYLSAEDLVLRELQSEFGVGLTRQMQVGALEFDGFFVKDGTAYIVEIKYVRSAVNRRTLEQTLEKIFTRIGLVGWRNFKVIFALVVGDPSVDLEQKRRNLQDIFEPYGSKIELRCYSFEKLSRKYGLSAS